MTNPRVTRRAPTKAEFDAEVDAAMPEAPDPVSPCLSCRHQARCEAEGLCCDASALFRQGLPEIRYRLAPRLPSRARWEAFMAVRARPKKKKSMYLHATDE